jgi:inward rectifier potassium channel
VRSGTEVVTKHPEQALIRFTPRPPLTPHARAVGRVTRPLEDIYHHVLTLPWSVTIAYLAGAFLAVNIVFAWLYTLEPAAIAGARPGSFEDAFYFSVQTVATIGYGAMHPDSRYGHLLVSAEAMIGIMCNALVTGLTFARFARPTARILFGARAVIGPADGSPHLMIRMANWRHNLLTDVRVQVLLLCQEISEDGEPVHRAIELPLVVDQTPILAVTWTVKHRLDANSPLHEPDRLARLRAAGAELVVCLRGIDDTFNTEVHARHRYTLDDIVVGAVFENVLVPRADGSRVLDYRSFHRIVAVDASPRS